MLHEIERIYAALSKPLRIRDERSTGPSNGGRTAINTLLLLNMIIVKKLTTPFDVSPSDL